MIAALKDHAQSHQSRADDMVVQFLEACHLIFEKGILSHQRINNANSPVLQNIRQGMDFFESWCNTHERTGTWHFSLILVIHFLNIFSIDIIVLSASGKIQQH